MATQKKAKLAHEKKGATTHEETSGRFEPTVVSDEVQLSDGFLGVVVTLDDDGTQGIIDRAYVRANPNGDGYIPGGMAVPETYDAVAKGRAVARYTQWSASQA